MLLQYGPAVLQVSPRLHENSGLPAVELIVAVERWWLGASHMRVPTAPHFLVRRPALLPIHSSRLSHALMAFWILEGLAVVVHCVRRDTANALALTSTASFLLIFYSILGSLQHDMRFCIGHESMRLSAPGMRFRSKTCRDAVVTARALVPLHASHPWRRPCLEKGRPVARNGRSTRPFWALTKRSASSDRLRYLPLSALWGLHAPSGSRRGHWWLTSCSPASYVHSNTLSWHRSIPAANWMLLRSGDMPGAPAPAAQSNGAELICRSTSSAPGALWALTHAKIP